MRFIVLFLILLIGLLGACSERASLQTSAEEAAKAVALSEVQELEKTKLEIEAKRQAEIEAKIAKEAEEKQQKEAKIAADKRAKKLAEYDRHRNNSLKAAKIAEEKADAQKIALETATALVKENRVAEKLAEQEAEETNPITNNSPDLLPETTETGD